MGIEISILLLALILLAVNIFQIRFSTPGSDHYFHFGYINSIKANSGRFITKVITFLNDDDFPDPQLFHWLLSLFPSAFLEKYFKYFGLVFNLFSFGFFILFFQYAYPYLNCSIPLSEAIWVAGLIYIFTPFEYFAWNAKNVGLSARGFGLMLGHLFLYGLFIYWVKNDYFYFIAASVFAYLVLLSSQFAFQFVIFFTWILSVLTGNWLVSLIPFIAVAGFLVTFPRWSIVFFKRQWQYKRMYFSILSPKFGLKSRYSIWRDFVYDFWKMPAQKGWVRTIEYIYRNPVVELLAGFPSLFLVLISVLWTGQMDVFREHDSTWIFIGCALIIFVLTSFRLTRFLGEPQRYIEFVFPIISFVPLFTPFLWDDMAVILFSLFMLMIELMAIKMLAKKHGGGNTTGEKTTQLLERFQQMKIKEEENKIASNNNEVLKYFAAKDFRILNVNVTSPYTGGIHFNDLFPESFGNYEPESLSRLVQYYKINWLIFDSKNMTKEEFIRRINIPLTFIDSIHHFTIFKVC